MDDHVDAAREKFMFYVTGQKALRSRGIPDFTRKQPVAIPIHCPDCTHADWKSTPHEWIVLFNPECPPYFANLPSDA